MNKAHWRNITDVLRLSAAVKKDSIVHGLGKRKSEFLFYFAPHCNCISKALQASLTKGLFLWIVIIADFRADCCELNINNGQQFKTLSLKSTLWEWNDDSPCPLVLEQILHIGEWAGNVFIPENLVGGGFILGGFSLEAQRREREAGWSNSYEEREVNLTEATRLLSSLMNLLWIKRFLLRESPDWYKGRFQSHPLKCVIDKPVLLQVWWAKVFYGVREMAQWLGVHATFAEDLNSVPTLDSSQLHMASGSKASDTLFCTGIYIICTYPAPTIHAEV